MLLCFLSPLVEGCAIRWQGFANTVARLCQYGGKALPIRWQDFANAMAKLCLYNGTSRFKACYF